LTASASLSIRQQADEVRLVLSGRLETDTVGHLWHQAMRAARQARGSRLVCDLGGVTFCDVGGATFLTGLEAEHGGSAELVGADQKVTALLERIRPAAAHGARREPGSTPLTAKEIAIALFGGLCSRLSFLGEAAIAVVRLPARRRMLRLPDLLRYIDQAGVRSLPLVAMLGYLIGLILAFQSAIPMRRYGADIYVSNLVALSLVRELGPLLAAVILSGRTGSAFAAEIGTMKVNEEVDALITMGLNPMTMLVLPRIVAAMLVMPVMAMVLDIAGMLGMATVLRGFGFALAAIAHQVQYWVTAQDVYGGLIKAVCFGIAVAAIGCRAGLDTGVGPRSVGLAATTAVVGGIVATIALDGVFALIFYRLNL
jgi:phospholipid/cholesterol/gamma-HCH transport system permease protein